jgi:hypothetical protein
MTAAVLPGWSQLPITPATPTFIAVTRTDATQNEADRIPNWAALMVAGGAAMAVGGFAAAWFTDGRYATLVLTLGLVAAAIGMRAAERAVNAPREWQPIADA